MSAPAKAADLLELLQAGWMTRAEIASAMGWSWPTAREWCDTWAARGLLERRHKSAKKRGMPAFEYRARISTPAKVVA